MTTIFSTAVLCFSLFILTEMCFMTNGAGVVRVRACQQACSGYNPSYALKLVTDCCARNNFRLGRCDRGYALCTDSPPQHWESVENVPEIPGVPGNIYGGGIGYVDPLMGGGPGLGAPYGVPY